MQSRQQSIFPKGILYRLGRSVFSVFVFSVFNTYAKVVVKGKERLPNEPFIICSNHQSHLDAIILAHISSYNFSKSALVAAKDYWYDHKGRFLISRSFFNTIPISRKTDNSEPFNINHVSQIASEFIQNGGKSIVILPEGSRSKDHSIRPFKKGVVLLSQSTNLKVVPAYIKDSGLRWPKGSFYIKPGKIHVEIGQAITANELTSDQGIELLRERIISLKEDTDNVSKEVEH